MKADECKCNKKKKFVHYVTFKHWLGTNGNSNIYDDSTILILAIFLFIKIHK